MQHEKITFYFRSLRQTRVNIQVLMIDADTEPLILDEAGGSSEFGSDGSNNASDEMAALNEEADLRDFS